jgi:hypothetical protein
MDIDTVKTAVMIETARYLITGNVSLPPATRLSDYANDAARGFFALTDAALGPLDLPEHGRQVDFLLVARHEVTLIAPAVTPREAPLARAA